MLVTILSLRPVPNARTSHEIELLQSSTDQPFALLEGSSWKVAGLPRFEWEVLRVAGVLAGLFWSVSRLPNLLLLLRCHLNGVGLESLAEFSSGCLCVR